MADYLQILRGITGGLEAGQNFRANRQIERAREQALESGEYDLEARRATRRIRDPESTRVLGALDPSSVQDYQQTFGDPFAFKLVDWFKQKRAARKKRSAMPIEEVGPPSNLANSYQSSEEDFGPPQYADGGAVRWAKDMTDEELAQERKELARRQSTELDDDLRKIAAPRLAEESVRNAGITDDGMRQRDERRANAGTLLRGAAGAEGAVNEFVAPVLGPNFIPQEGAGKVSTSGPRFPRASSETTAVRRQRQALPLEEIPSTGAPASRAAALPTGGGMRPQRTASAVPAQGDAERVDFSQIDADPKDVPNMTTDDWREYRAKIVDAARLSGRPEAIAQANNLVTQMQQQGFLSYGQQGLALQQAGNLKGAMAAYRAAFQYFPNGNDVEFGLIKDRQGQQQIVGFGRDEKTGKIVEGSQIVMNPEQAARLLENFTKPEAFRAWTKDWRDFEEGKRRFDAQLKNKQSDDAFRLRRFEEVEKPLAQANADALATRGEADLLRAERTGVSGTFRPGDLQRSEAAFRERLELVGLTDEAKKDQLASVMSQIKASNPNTPDNVIINAVIAAERDGTLAQRLKAMGIQ